jgi:putative PIN family toxin of toxin-antitoxin system
MRVVFDTNVVLSGMLWGGSPRLALEQIRLERAVLLSSQPLVDELKDVLSRQKFEVRLAEINRTPDELIYFYNAIIEMVDPAPIGQVIEADPKDDKFLACAVGGQAVAVVSGDHHLLDLKTYAQIDMLTVETFLTQVAPEDEG